MSEQNYVSFTKEMKKTYTILAPNMLPIHFELILQVLRNEGYTIELLKATGPEIVETGLKYVHNDTCYPAILVIGQFIHAIQSGKYDPHRVALIYFQTGGGCRASNYIFLLRKALQRAGYGYIPVISFSMAGLEKHPGFSPGIPTLHRMVYALLYADLLMSLVGQTRPYEKQRGEAQALADTLCRSLADEMKQNGVSWRRVKPRMREIIRRFAEIPCDRSVKKPLCGVVGEIYVKFSPLGNNNLEQFLTDNGAEVALPGLMNFMLSCLYNQITDYTLYRRGRFSHIAAGAAYKFILQKQREVAALYRESGVFRAPEDFAHTVDLAEKCIGHGCKMGEGWLLPAEMLALADSGVHNIVCAQPFGCLPNHICGKGMMKPIKEAYPEANIVAIDYDASASRVNQENRLKLMLSNAQ